MEEIKKKLADLKERFEKISNLFDRDTYQRKIRELEAETLKLGFWEEQERARKISQDLAKRQKLLSSLENLDRRIQNAFELAEENALKQELRDEVSQINSLVKNLELKLFLSGPHDESEAILSVHSGAGGVEAMDWTAMLARMYQRYFDRMSWRYEITDESFGEEAGYKSITFLVHAEYSYGLLKGEAGTHRLVRQSPFNADNLRQTSFALVEVLPVIEDRGEIFLNPNDLEFEAFRASGAGGQNVNKVSTAVRLKHLPSGLIVTAQTERSQLQNRENASRILKAKLWQLKKEEQAQQTKALKGETKLASWGNQIRSYVLHPYHLVKDLRTNIESSDTDAVLGGEIDQFIEAEVRSIGKSELSLDKVK